MSKREMTTEELTLKWECIREIENLMGRRSFLGTQKKSLQVLNDFWCKKASDPCLGFNNGYYKGYEAIEDYYKAVHNHTALKTELVKKANPELASRSAEELFGIGSLVMDNLSTPIIELAGDFKTAKGLWYYMKGETDYESSGTGTIHRWGWVGVDFVLEDDDTGSEYPWKIWHMVVTEDIVNRAGTAWTAPLVNRPAVPEYAAIDELKLPEPNVPQQVFEAWHKKRKITPFPQVPQRYDTFANTFSYGV